MRPKPERQPWLQLRTLERAQVLLILPCNEAACGGKYPRVVTDPGRIDAEGQDTPWGSRPGRTCRPSSESGGDYR